MSRRTRKRRTERRKRKAGEALLPRPPEPDTPVDWDRITARFRSFRGRSLAIGYVPIGPLVEARSPQELVVNTALEIARSSKCEPQN